MLLCLLFWQGRHEWKGMDRRASGRGHGSTHGVGWLRRTWHTKLNRVSGRTERGDTWHLERLSRLGICKGFRAGHTKTNVLHPSLHFPPFLRYQYGLPRLRASIYFICIARWYFERDSNESELFICTGVGVRGGWCGILQVANMAYKQEWWWFQNHMVRTQMVRTQRPQKKGLFLPCTPPMYERSRYHNTITKYTISHRNFFHRNFSQKHITGASPHSSSYTAPLWILNR